MRRVARVVGVLAVLLFVTASAQSKPDFSGKWAAVASTARADGVVLTIVQDATSITIASPSPRGGTETDRLSLKLDGSPGKYGMFRGDGTIQEREARADWSGDKVVISLKASSNKLGDYTIKETLSLDGERMVMDIVWISDATGATIVSPGSTTFRKQ
jgi:hypothetical protein